MIWLHGRTAQTVSKQLITLECFSLHVISNCYKRCRKKSEELDVNFAGRLDFELGTQKYTFSNFDRFSKTLTAEIFSRP